MRRVNLNMTRTEDALVSMDIFIHGEKLWRLQKSVYPSGDAPVETESIDFTKEEYEKTFGRLPVTVDLS